MNLNPLRPSGKISVDDTQLGLEGVKNINLRAQNDIFGFSWSFTQSDVNGCFKFNRAFTANNISIKALFKNDRIWMRSYRGARVWNMILLMDATRTVNKPFNNLCINFMDDNGNGASSKTKEEWAGCTAFNAIEEYHILKSNFGLSLPTGRLEITITHHGSNAGAPMLSEHFEEDLLDDIVLIWLGISFPPVGIPIALFLAAIKEGLPDIWYPYDLFEPSDKMKYVMYHELGHASHYTRVNTTDFWGVYRDHIIAHGGYGDGMDPNSELIAVAEPFADVIGHIFADATYGIDHSNGPDILRRWIFILELEIINLHDPTTCQDDWVPWGFYYDLIDNNSANPVGISDCQDDQVSGYTINSVFSILDENVRSMNTLEQRLINILPAGITSNQVNLLIDEYGF